MEFFLSGVELSLNLVKSENMINQLSMNWGQFKDLSCHRSLLGTEVGCSSLSQEAAGSDTVIFFCKKYLQIL